MKKKNIIFITLCALFILAFNLLEVLSPGSKYSLSERRLLAQMPSFELEKLENGKYMTEFETFTLDQAPYRDSLRSIKAYVAKYVFGQSDNHGLFTYGDYVSQLNYPANYNKTDISLNKLQKVYDKYLKASDSSIYFSIIPDKNYYISVDMLLPVIDYAEYTAYITEKLSFAEYIDIFDDLSLDYYYKTDQHWNQKYLPSIAEKLATTMGAPYSPSLYSNDLDVPFFGAYVGQSALSFTPDTISYFTSPALENAIVTSFDTGKARLVPLYNSEKANGRDAYDFFLGGADALLTIDNPNAVSDKRLIIFRDSFASSLAPLLVESYSKITLVDLRYINPDLLDSFISFDGQDVLFLYSTLVLNAGV